MIVPCECGAKLKIDDAKIADRDVRIRCPRCGNVLTVPRATASEPVQAESTQRFPAATRNAAPLVLIAHDSDVVRDMVGGVLLDAGYRVDHASDGVEAMEKARSVSPQVMIVDVGIPGIYGFELCERLKGDAVTRGIKIILLASVYGITRYKRNPTSLYGADDFIEKHHIADSLVGKIEGLLDDGGQGDITQSVQPKPGSTTEDAKERNTAPESSFFMPESLMGDVSSEDQGRKEKGREAGAGEEAVQEAQAIAPESFSLDASIFEKEECDIPRVEETDPEAVEKAKRFARIIVSDIALYNQEAVREGIKNGTLYELLRDDIEEGRRLYEGRVPEIVRASSDYYRETIEGFIASQKKIGR